ncbi:MULTISPECIES: hypothetical protein [unclassified Pseudonocardia]|uniref:hypothetical protein n=1 Tax=unclassified Pseudonocardia TaxID=2619320 RepID=UPI00094B4500|nr:MULTISPECIES: hypothetical protein [unclassified Pseudonocardia]
MSGYRRRAAALSGAEVEAVSRRGRRERRRGRFVVRFASAGSDVERLCAAFDYARGAASRRHPDPAEASRLVESVTSALVTAGDRLLELQAREPLSAGRGRR